MLLLLLFDWPPVREVCPNHEDAKAWAGTSLDLGSIYYCYVSSPPKEATHFFPSSHTIASCPVYPCIGSSSHPGVPFLCPSMLKSPYLPHHLLHGVVRSPDRWPSPSVFSVPPSPLSPQRINVLLRTSIITNIVVFLLLRPSLRQNIFYSSP